MKRGRKRIMTWLIILLSLYVIYCGLLFFFQTKLMFPAEYAGQATNALPTPKTEVIELPTDEGTTTAWFIPAPGASVDQPAPLVVFLHGNAELIDHQSMITGLYHQLGVSVLLVEYRGYGHSDGTPSEAHIVADTLAILGDVLKRNEVDADRLALHGRSIGGALAAQVALKPGAKALIVESTFKSAAGMAWRYGVPPFLVTSPLRTEQAFRELNLPILILHGLHDDIVPYDHGRALLAAARNAVLVGFDADHNTLPGPAEAEGYEQVIRDHLTTAGVIRSRSVSEPSK